MQALHKTLRNTLEKTVKKARDVAEEGAHAALQQLGVGDQQKPGFLTDEQAELRRRLRASRGGVVTRARASRRARTETYRYRARS